MANAFDKTKHVAYQRMHESADTAVVFVHGLFGSPNQISVFENALFEAGFDVHAVLLPGHGGSGKEFAHNGYAKWQQHVDGEIKKLSEQYSRVFLIGHSVGGHLCLMTARHVTVNGIVLWNTPYRVKLSLVQLRMCVKILFGNKQTDDDFLKSNRRAFSVENKNVFRMVTWVPRLLDVMKMSTQVRKVLGEIKVPVLVIQCKKDESVWRHSGALFANHLQNARKIALIKSGHGYLTQDECRTATQEILAFINENAHQ